MATKRKRKCWVQEEIMNFNIKVINYNIMHKYINLTKIYNTFMHILKIQLKNRNEYLYRCRHISFSFSDKKY